MKFISDEKGNRLYYRLNLQDEPMGLPLLVVLHGHGSTVTRFKYEGWNVLSPLDNFGYQNNGCWWLGEQGEFFVKDLLQKLIKEISKQYNCEDNIYFYGSSMGGYGAILHGILSGARAVYANVPQILLHGSTYFKLNLIKEINFVLSNKNILPIENDLVKFLENSKNKNLPIFFLCENMIYCEGAYENYLQEHTLRFLNKCIELNKKCHVELLPYSGHTKNYGLKEVLMKFERFAPPLRKEINLNREFRLIEGNWFVNKNNNSKVLFREDYVKCNISFDSNNRVFYLVSGSSSLTGIDENCKRFDISNYSNLNFELEIDYDKDCDIRFFIIQFNENGRVETKSFPLRKGYNIVNYIKNKDAKYLKIAFRVYSEKVKNVNFIIKKVKFLNKDKKDNELSFKIIDYGKNSDIELFDPIIKYNDYYHHKMKLNNFILDMLSFYKKSDKLIVFFNGAINVSRTPLPVFQRWSWLKKLPYSAIVISDPTIYELQKMYYGEQTLIGWYQGEKSNFILEKILIHIKKIAEKLNVKNENILFYGSSAGGFASLISASILKDSMACVVNPQTNILKYHKKYVDFLLKYLEIEDDDLKEKKYHFDVIKFFKKENSFPKVYYKQNKLDKDHYLNHFLYFKDEYEKRGYKDRLKIVIFNDERGHSAIPLMEEALNDINECFNYFKKKNNEIIDMKFFGFIKNESTLSYFKPRKDVPGYDLVFPLNWDLDPFKDRNWCFQLHSWRMMDNALLEFENTKNIDLLKNIIEIIKDWYLFSLKKETKYTWYDMSTGLRALKLVYLYNRLQNFDLSLQNEIKFIKELSKLHLEKLLQQKISSNNHGIFQVHGLIMLSWLLNDKNGISYGLKEMEKLLKEQFNEDGYHTENSDEYHWFVLNIFSKFLSFKVYKNNQKIKDILSLAEETKKWTVFPNNESLMIGDSSYTKRKIDLSIKNNQKTFIKYFQYSGYLFINNYDNKDSFMLFFKTAYKNKTHAHSDDFNILLYEYDKNILVDSGKYSYDYTSLERKYVVSSRAHNVLSIDDIDYRECDFYESALQYCEEKRGIYEIKASLNRRKIDVHHDRYIIYKPQYFLIVVDKLNSLNAHKYTQYWHFHQDLDVKRQNINSFFSKINDNVIMEMDLNIINLDDEQICLGKSELIKLIKGQREPYLQGWRSLRYKELFPNYALEHTCESKNCVLITKFVFKKKDNNNDINLKIVGDSSLKIFSKNLNFETYIEL